MSDTYNFIYYNDPNDIFTVPTDYIINKEGISEEEVVKNLLFITKDISKCAQIFKMYKSLKTDATFSSFVRLVIESFIPEGKTLSINLVHILDATEESIVDCSISDNNANRARFFVLNDSIDARCYTIPQNRFRESVAISAADISLTENHATIQEMLNRIETLEEQIRELRDSR